MENNVEKLSDAELHELIIDVGLPLGRRAEALAELDLRRRKHEFALLETWIERWRDRVLTAGDVFQTVDGLAKFWREKTEAFIQLQVESAEKFARQQDTTARRLNDATRRAAIAAVFSAIAALAAFAVDFARLIAGK